jgi:tripeptide aminopeptidase
MSSLVDRFMRYVKINTQSQEGHDTVPSTACQFDLAKVLGEELRAMGVKDVTVTDHAYVCATLPSNTPGAPAIGFCSHIDTATECSGKDVKPRLIEKYDGGDIVLNAEKHIVMSPDMFEALKKHVGDSLIVTDGTTLLGADDKAGVAEIMTAVEYMVQHPEFKHGKIVVCFCPDEEIGHGARLWDLDKYGADFAYTVDGDGSDEFAYETFNAAQAHVTIHGVVVHPGTAKNKMVNASMLGVEFAQSLPPAETPAHTELREGYYHLTEIHGGVETCEMTYIIRDHDTEKFNARKEHFKLLVRQLNERWGKEYAELEMHDQYYNMAVPLQKRMDIVKTALKAYEMEGITPVIKAARGGTDGSQLSFRGLLTPNLFIGGYNCHGPFEFAVVQSMEKCVKIILNIVNMYATGQQVK